MSTPSQDERFMTQALDLARQGTALSSPGARVGAVVLDQTGAVAGTGFYTYDGLQHAEALALSKAGQKAHGGTLYVNLEPCSHHGRTPPCADLIIAAGIRRVVAAMADPNPLVAGKGFQKLRAAGIHVESGMFEREARRLNESFARYILEHRPLVTLKSAMTLDGKIASAPDRDQPVSRSTTYITGAEARAHVQELRHQADAIMVGVGTVLADDPLLTDRTGRPRRRPLLRIVVDSRLRLPIESRLVDTAADDVVVFCSRPDENKRRALTARGVRVEQVSPEPNSLKGHPDLWRVVDRLGEMEIASLLIEGGAQVNGAALAAGIVDKIFFYYAPKILGGSDSVPFASGRSLKELVHVSDMVLHRFGEDIAIEGYLRDPYASMVREEAIAQKVEKTP
jgi:diaminohydroxyphosphoribosylaminopyrimidine deaminase / 5-amino-6-(5-phosphoribosylamino)uracil reductase